MDCQTAASPNAGKITRANFVHLTPALQTPGFVMTFDRNEEIFGEEEPADFVYKVISGVVRTSRILSDGRRQISGFHLPGDLFGFELGDEHRCAAEAVCEAEIALTRRTALKAAARRDGGAAHELWTLTARNLERAEQHLMLLGRKSAAERVASFLAAMAERGGCAHAVDLPMCRHDIADYLGLTIETVSRSLSQLERDGLIELSSSRRILLRNRSRLAALAGAGEMPKAA